MFQKFDTKTWKQRKNETYMVWVFILKDLVTKCTKTLAIYIYIYILSKIK